MANQIKNLTLAGRLSYPVFTYAEALSRNEKSQYAKQPEAVSPEYNLLLEQPAVDKAVAYMLDDFLPWVLTQHKSGDKKFEKLDDKMVKRLSDAISAQDWETQPPYLPFKSVPEKTKEMAPEAVAMFKIVGNKQQDLELKAIVRSDDELLVPGNDIITDPVIKPISETVHEMYAGCVAGTTLNLYAYINGKLPGIGAGGPKLVFKSDADRFGGGVALDEEELFED